MHYSKTHKVAESMHNIHVNLAGIQSLKDASEQIRRISKGE